MDYEVDSPCRQYLGWDGTLGAVGCRGDLADFTLSHVWQEQDPGAGLFQVMGRLHATCTYLAFLYGHQVAAVVVIVVGMIIIMITLFSYYSLLL